MKVKISELPNDGTQYYFVVHNAKDTVRSKQFETQFRELVTSMRGIDELEWFSAMIGIKSFAAENGMDPNKVEQALVALNISATPQLAVDNELLVDHVIKGEVIDVWDFRDNLTKSATALADEYFDQEEGNREVRIRYRFTTIGEHYAIFNESTNRWESGEM